MKTQSILGFILSCTAILTLSKSFAQNSSDYTFSGVTVNASPAMPVINGMDNKSSKVQSAFSNYFKNAANESWSKINKNYYVNFTVDGNKNRAMLTKAGNLIYTIFYGSEKDLPKEVRKQIKGTYYDYSIMSAIKVQQNNRMIWVVQMEDEKTNLTVRVEDGEMEEVRQFIKS